MLKKSKFDLADIDLETAIEALSYCDCFDRDQWVQMGMALKDEFGEAAFADWDRWSQQDVETYKSSHALASWKSFKKRGIGIGSLIEKAKENGFKFSKKEMSIEEKNKLKLERENRLKKLEEEKAAKEIKNNEWRLKLSDFLISIMNNFDSEGSSEYLSKKKTPGFGVLFSQEPMVIVADEEKDLIELHKGFDKFSAFLKIPKKEQPKFRIMKKGVFAIPLVDIDGRLWNLQIIQDTGWKSFFPGKKQGCFHVIGNIPDNGRFNVCIAEGYANAACIHMALQCPVIVAFDSGNLKKVAIAIKGKYKDRINRFAICADDDRHLESKGKKNVGMEKAIKTAKSVDGIVISPVIDDLKNNEILEAS